MMFRKIVIATLIVASAVLISSCTSIAPQLEATANANAPSEVSAVYAELAKAGGKLFTLDPNNSSVRIYVFRGGRLPNLGHNHVLSAPKFIGYFYNDASGSRFDLEFRLDELEIDHPVIRAAAGRAFSSTLSAQAIASTREHMLGDDNLQANRYPFVRIHSLQIVGEAPKFSAKIQIELHGTTREMWVPLHVEGVAKGSEGSRFGARSGPVQDVRRSTADPKIGPSEPFATPSVEGLPEHLMVSGSFVLRQTDFGVQPYSVLGGMLAVQDEVLVEFQLVGN